MNATTFSVNRIASRLLRRFLEKRVVTEEPVLGSRIVSVLEQRQSVAAAATGPRPSLQMSDRLQVPQVGVL